VVLDYRCVQQAQCQNVKRIYRPQMGQTQCWAPCNAGFAESARLSHAPEHGTPGWIPLLLPIGQPPGHFHRRAGFGKQESLCVATFQLLQDAMFTQCLHTFANRFEGQLFGHCHYRRKHAAFVVPAVNVLDEAAVDFHAADRKLLKRRDRCVTGPEIIQVDPTAQFSERDEIAPHDVVASLGHDRFEHFDHKAFCRQSSPVEFDPGCAIRPVTGSRSRRGR